MKSYSVIGLGKLGACMLAAIGARGHRVIGSDLNPAVVTHLAAGRAPVIEPELQEMLTAAGSNLTVTNDPAAAVQASDVTFIVVPTPSEADGSFSTRYLRSALTDVGRALRDKLGYHLVVVTSTVLPGACMGELVPLLEETSRRRAGNGFGFCYSPEFIALGSVIHDFLQPAFLLVGEFDARSGAVLEESYAGIVNNGAPCKRMSLENAELAKLALNAFVTTKIAFANTLAALCEALPNGDVDVVTDAIGADPRVGHAYLRGGLGFGGPCFPRDNAAFAHLARQHGMAAHLAEATDRANGDVPGRVVAAIHARVERPARVAVLGLAYKPGTPVSDQSQGVSIAASLAGEGYEVVAYDPLVAGGLGERLGGAVELANSVEGAIEGADCVVLTTMDPAFDVLPERLGLLASNPVIVDCWRSVDPARLPGALVVALGRQRAASVSSADQMREVAND